MRRWAGLILLVLIAAAAAAWVSDTAIYLLRGSPTRDVAIDKMYAMKNRWNEVEYSVGGAGYEHCANALFPHSNYRPCWYVTSHTMQYIHIG